MTQFVIRNQILVVGIELVAMAWIIPPCYRRTELHNQKKKQTKKQYYVLDCCMFVGYYYTIFVDLVFNVLKKRFKMGIDGF